MAQHLDELKEIREMMQKSTRFISLSGLSGVFAGIYALIGAYVAYTFLGFNEVKDLFFADKHSYFGRFIHPVLLFWILDGVMVLFLAVLTSLILTYRNAKKNNEKVFSPTSIRMALNLLIPLSVGGIFGMILLSYGLIGLVLPSTMIFYGLSLVNASNFTLRDIRYLGYLQILIGIVALLDIKHGIYYWALGFGVLHILYGGYMYFKYEYKKHA